MTSLRTALLEKRNDFAGSAQDVLSGIAIIAFAAVVIFYAGAL